MSLCTVNGYYLLVIFGFRTISFVAHALDPCYDYMSITDTNLTTNNTVDGTNPGFRQHGWYRETASTEGLLLLTCPTGNVCGTSSQLWMNDTVPSYLSGETQVRICIRGRTNCCERRQNMLMKNCNTFVVYNLLPLPASSGYCFESNSHALTPVSTTSTTTSTTKSTTTVVATVAKAVTNTAHRTLAISTTYITATLSGHPTETASTDSPSSSNIIIIACVTTVTSAVIIGLLVVLSMA